MYLFIHYVSEIIFVSYFPNFKFIRGFVVYNSTLKLKERKTLEVQMLHMDHTKDFFRI